MVTITSIDDFINQDSESRSVIAQKHTESLKKIVRDNPQITDSVFAAIVNKAGVTSLTELRDIFSLRNELMGFISNPSSLNVEEVLETVSNDQPGFAGVVEAEPVEVEAKAAVVEATAPAVETAEVVAPNEPESPAEESPLPSGFGSMGMPRMRTAVSKAQGRSPVLRTSRSEPESSSTVTDTLVDEVVAELADKVPTPVVVATTDAAPSSTTTTDSSAVSDILRKLTDRIKTLTRALESAHAENNSLRSELANAKNSVSVPSDVLSDLKALGIDI